MDSLQSGDALGASYRLQRPIGSGAAGEVWLAEPVGGGAPLAAKILRSEHAGDPALVERFVRERSVLLGLRHENIVDVRDLVVEGATLAIVMEYVAGGSLRDLLDSRGTLAPSDALLLCAQVLRAVAAAHAQRVTHRDIKPDNVLLTTPWAPGEANTVRVTDFGIASVVNERNRHTTGLLGTPQYMAPELISHGQTGPAADVYSTGVMLYELIAGRTPFAGPGTDFTIAYRHVTSPPPPLDLPLPLWELIAGLLAKDPRQRPDAAEAAVMLDRLAREHRGLAASPPVTVAPAFEEIERPATMLRGGLEADPVGAPGFIAEVDPELPELGVAGQHTILRPMPLREPIAPPTPEPAAPKHSWLTKKVLLLGAAGVFLLAGLTVGIVIAFGGGDGKDADAAKDNVQATQQDQGLPTGLGTSRTAEFQPSTGNVTLELTFSAQKAPLTGEFFTAVPALGDDKTCPAVTWEGAKATRHQTSTTGLKAECGWKLEGVRVPENGQITVVGSFPGTVADASELSTWLNEAATATTQTLTDPDTITTAYPAQRLQDISVKVPSRAVSQTPLQVTLLPVWPSGPDELNPLFKSPSTGKPSWMLQSIVGENTAPRFADGCSSAVSVAPDGVTVTALTVTSNCRLRASVGNFTSLESSPFSITTRG